MSLFTTSTDSAETPASSASEAPTAYSSVQWISLSNRGFREAGKLLGRPEGLTNLLHSIREGFLQDENNNSDKQRQERLKVEAKISELEGQIRGHQTELNRIGEGEIKKLEVELQHLQRRLDELELERLRAEKNPETVNTFNVRLYWPIFALSTVFLYVFYVSTFYSAFFRKLTDEASQDGADIDSVLSAVFSPAAFTQFNLHYAAPVVFFLFGVVLHVLFDQGGRWRWVRTGGMLLFILAVDALLAYSLEKKIQRVLEMMDRPIEPFYTSPVFYMVLTLGFFTCLGWSILLHEIRTEYAKTDLERLLREEIKQNKAAQDALQTQIQTWRAKRVEIEGLITQLEAAIEQLRKEREAIILNLWDLRKRIAEFYDGWLKYVVQTGRDRETLLQQCEEAYQAFCQKYFSSVHSAPTLAQA